MTDNSDKSIDKSDELRDTSDKSKDITDITYKITDNSDKLSDISDKSSDTSDKTTYNSDKSSEISDKNKYSNKLSDVSDKSYDKYNSDKSTYKKADNSDKTNSYIKISESSDKNIDTSYKATYSTNKTTDTSDKTKNESDKLIDTIDKAIETLFQTKDKLDTIIDISGKLTNKSDKTKDESDTSDETTNTPIPIDKNQANIIEKETEIITEKSVDTTPNASITEDEELEEVQKRLNITISFRQVNNFSFSSNTIVFWLYTLVSDNLKTGYKITVFANLFKSFGKLENDTKEITCILDSDTKPLKNGLDQANFKCTLNGLSEPYYSLRLNSSEDVSSIQKDNEIALDPLLTAELSVMENY